MKTMNLGDVIITYELDTVGSTSCEMCSEFLKMTQRDEVVCVKKIDATDNVSEAAQMDALRDFCKNLGDKVILYQVSVQDMSNRDTAGQITLAASTIKFKRAGFMDVSEFFGEQYIKQFIFYNNREGISAYQELKAYELGQYMYDILKDEKCKQIFTACLDKEPETRKTFLELMSSSVREISAF